MIENFIDTDERQDVISSLQMTLTAIQLAHKDPIYWKWVILALHSGLQGAMVCHLNRSDGFGASKDTDVKKWYAWNDSGRKEKEPKVKLAVPTDLFKWISDPKRNPGNIMWKPVLMSKNRQAAFNLLHSLRNPFTHFQPISWNIEIDGLPNMVSEIVSIIDEIYRIGWGFFKLKAADKHLLNDLIRRIKLQI